MPNCPRKGRCGPRTKTASASGSRTTPRSSGPAGRWSSWPTAWAARARARWPAAWPSTPPCRSSARPSREPRPARPSGRCSPPPTWPSTTRAWSTATEGRMATTLTVAVLRNDEVTIGHVGDCRAYLVQEGRMPRLTADHSYAALQVKLGLISAARRRRQPDALHAHPQRGPGADGPGRLLLRPGQSRRPPRAMLRRPAPVRDRGGNLRDRHCTTRPRRPAAAWSSWPRSAAPTTTSPCRWSRSSASSRSCTIADCPSTTSRSCP